MFLTFVSGMPANALLKPAYAQTSATGVTAETLLQNPGALGTNVTQLLQSGADTSAIANTLFSANPSGASAQQWNSVLTNLSANGASTQTAAALVDGMFAGTVDANVANAISSNKNLGQITTAAGLQQALSDPSLKNALSSLSPEKAATAIDQVLQAALGSNFDVNAMNNLLNDQSIEALVNTIAAAVPGLADLLGLAGLQEGLIGGLNALAGGLVDNALGALLGGDLTSALAGGLFNGLGSQAFAALGLGSIGNCACTICMVSIPQHHVQIRTDVTDQFEVHRRWLLTTFFIEHLLPALMLMAEQLTVAGIYQVEVIGTFLDAKHQLETQRLFQTLTAEAHKDYHPSEGMCTIGTAVRSLAESDRRSNLAQIAYANRMMQRQTASGQNISYEFEDSDLRGRMAQFISTYCDQADNGNGLGTICPAAVTPARRNIDVDYTRNIESRLTLDMDFQLDPAATADETDVFALAANLYSHEMPTKISPSLFGYADGEEEERIRLSAQEKYLDQRAIFAKRSVAQNSFAALTAMRAAGNVPGSAPYTKAIIKELGVADDAEIEKLLGANPSYFAQMEVLTKKLYQNPVFYTDLYDKPANIERKGAALQAIGLMQDRDLYNSLLRSEAVLSVLLETMLQKEQGKIENIIGNMDPAGGKN
ncbi:MAG: hypothetical protein DI551_00315 [Micavibrio aeruginosavorus]|uniref:Uncharacterized protein n=1 Tax=Micavibrio aeruginosavorus TaxID=349221 RepID=A0A2W5NA18_9BACT|nr:MAG: hypothetical protein DI551_00315 [Micavibrio aeruginosavorus]